MKFIIYTPELDLKSGGIIALHHLAKELLELGHQCLLFVASGEKIPNVFCNHFASLQDIDDEAIVIYPEIVEGNPLNAKCVVRWILCDIGVHTGPNIFKTWHPQDLVFHFSTFSNRYDLESVEILYTTWIDPGIKNQQLMRQGSCYLFKKASLFHRKIHMIHPKDAVMIDHCTNAEIIDLFNRSTFFYCYDPYSFYDVIALYCGCIPVIYPLENLTKQDWLLTRGAFQMHVKKQGNISGIAYGEYDIPYAVQTLENAQQEQLENLNFIKSTILNFIEKVSAYFGKNRAAYSFKTVEKLAGIFWLEDKFENAISKKNQEIDHLSNKVTETHQHLINLYQLLEQKEHEINFMKSSKFWKLRQFVKRYI